MTNLDLHKIFGGPILAIAPDRLMSAIVNLQDAQQAGEPEAARPMGRKFSPVKGNIAVLPLHGPIVQKAGWWSDYGGFTSTEQFGQWLDVAVADPTVKVIVIDIDSPGGSVYGVRELADKIYAARESKQIIAVANSLMASAAYWIGSAAEKIVATPGADVGSIGVIAMHADWSQALESAGIKLTILRAPEFKGEGNPYEPLTEAAQKDIQAGIDDWYGHFVSAVARNRDVTAATVRADFGKGRTLMADDALAAKMIDRVATLETVLSELTGGAQPVARRRGAEMTARTVATKQRQHATAGQ